MRRFAPLLLACFACAGADGPVHPTPHQIVRASGLVRPGDSWSAAYPSLHDRLGPPTRVTGSTYYWATRIGPDCYMIEVRTLADTVTYVDDSYRVGPPSYAPYRRCAWAARR